MFLARDFTYIDNIVAANLLACKAEGVGGQMFNVACGESFTLNQLCQDLQEIMGTSKEPLYEEARVGDVKHSLADIEKAKKMLSFKVLVSFREGLRNTVEWFSNNP